MTECRRSRSLPIYALPAHRSGTRFSVAASDQWQRHPAQPGAGPAGSRCSAGQDRHAGQCQHAGGLPRPRRRYVGGGGDVSGFTHDGCAPGTVDALQNSRCRWNSDPIRIGYRRGAGAGRQLNGGRRTANGEPSCIPSCANRSSHAPFAVRCSPSSVYRPHVGKQSLTLLVLKSAHSPSYKSTTQSHSEHEGLRQADRGAVRHRLAVR